MRRKGGGELIIYRRKPQKEVKVRGGRERVELGSFHHFLPTPGVIFQSVKSIRSSYITATWQAAEGRWKDLSVWLIEMEAQCVSTSDYQKRCVCVCVDSWVARLWEMVQITGNSHLLPASSSLSSLRLRFQNVTWQTCDLGMLYHPPPPLCTHTGTYSGSLGYFVFRGRHWLEEETEVGGGGGGRAQFGASPLSKGRCCVENNPPVQISSVGNSF